MNKTLLFLLLVLPIHSFAAPSDYSVIGNDDRLQVKASKNRNDPYNRIGHLLNKNGECTGTLIAPKIVLTAAHCIYDEVTKSVVKPETVTFYPGRSKSLGIPFGAFKARKILTYKEYVLTQKQDYDVALIELAADPQVGFFEIAESVDYVNLPRQTIYIAGYAGDKEFGTLWESKGSGANYKPMTRIMFYTLDTFAGQSGSSIRVKMGGVEKVIGVHTDGDKYENSGVRFNAEILGHLRLWMKNMSVK